MPIKYGVPPFTTASTNMVISDFEAAAADDYVAPATFDGWTVISNQVSVIGDPALAYGGNNFLALANGSISNTLQTVAGRRYVLRFAYRGPGIVSMWRGETNANDSVDGNNGTMLNGGGYTTGMVATAFNFGGTALQQAVDIPYSPSLINSNYSVDAWIDPRAQPNNPPDNQDWVFGQNSGLQLNIRDGTNGVLVDFQFRSGNNRFYDVVSTNEIPMNQFSHVAGTWDGTTLRLYINGILNAQRTPGVTPVDSGCDFFIGGTYNPVPGSCQTVGQFFDGIIDEVSLYNRVLSLSEIQAIYNADGAGKFDPAAPIPGALAEAHVALEGVSTNVILGNNRNWQVYAVTFTAGQNGTPLQLDGLKRACFWIPSRFQSWWTAPITCPKRR